MINRLSREGYLKMHSMDEVHELGWKAFEYFSKYLLEEKEYENVRVTKKEGKYHADGGVDINAEHDGFPVIGQCKHYSKGRGGYTPIEDIRALGGSMKEKNINNGVFISTVSFGKAAQISAKKLNIKLIGFEEIEQLLTAKHSK